AIRMQRAQQPPWGRAGEGPSVRTVFNMSPIGQATNFALAGLQFAPRIAPGGLQLPPFASGENEDRLPAGATLTEGAAPQAAVVDTLSKLLDQKTALQAELARATAERDAQSKTGRGPKYQSAVDLAKELTDKMGNLDAQIADEQAARKKAGFA